MQDLQETIDNLRNTKLLEQLPFATSRKKNLMFKKFYQINLEK